MSDETEVTAVPRLNRESSRKAVRREFARTLQRFGRDPSPHLVAHLADEFLAAGWTHPNDAAAYLTLCYADPTGETAVANVMRGAATR